MECLDDRLTSTAISPYVSFLAASNSFNMEMALWWGWEEEKVEKEGGKTGLGQFPAYLSVLWLGCQHERPLLL